MGKRTNKQYYNRTNTCDGCGICFEEIKKLGYRPHREYNKEGNWTGKWTCITCYNNKIRYGTYEKPENFYNDTNICERCKKEKLIPGKAYREIDKDEKETGRWICNICKSKDYRSMSDSHNNIIKSLRDRRTGNLTYQNHIIGDNFEELTHRWKGVKILSKENDNYNGPLDHSADPEGKIPQTKGKRYDYYNQRWSQNFGNEHSAVARGFDFDYLIFYCTSKDGKIIERIYIFPLEEILKRTNVTIYGNPSKGVQWYEQYRIKDEETIKKVNDIWKNIIQ